MEKNSNKGLKKLILLLLLFVGLGASVTAGAYWASSFTAKNPTIETGTVEVSVGEGKVVTVSTTLGGTDDITGDGLYLVPAGFVVVKTKQTATKSFTVKADWNISSDNNPGTGGITLDDIAQNGVISATAEVTAGIKLDESTEENVFSLDKDKKLFEVTITPVNGGAIALGSSNEISVTVTMTEPANKAQYDRVANAKITITFTLSIEVVNSITITGDSSGSVGDSIALTAVLAANLTGETVWTSSVETLATVSDAGVVTLLNAGTVTITAENGGIKTTHKIAIIE